MDKLNTKEDSSHIHKISGFTCVMNYFFQIIYFLVYNVHHKLLIYTLSIHFILHLSSLKFHIRSKRDSNSKFARYHIWKEFRFHSMVFAYRAIFCILFPKSSFYFVILAMILADIVTKKYGNCEETTVRGNVYKERPIYLIVIQYFFIISQFNATWVCIFHSYEPILLFATLPPIQLSAFFMTLLRKNIISIGTWQILYTISLLVSYLLYYRMYGKLDNLLYGFMILLTRKYFIPNKYVLWTLLYIIILVLV